ncbi:MAG: hypothetical protein HQK49_16015 [Oligoflexia bacterium]|nr:hypothetical protein [Oligoflexia bacterium]
MKKISKVFLFIWVFLFGGLFFLYILNAANTFFRFSPFYNIFKPSTINAIVTPSSIYQNHPMRPLITKLTNEIQKNNCSCNCNKQYLIGVLGFDYYLFRFYLFPMRILNVPLKLSMNEKLDFIKQNKIKFLLLDKRVAQFKHEYNHEYNIVADEGNYIILKIGSTCF